MHWSIKYSLASVIGTLRMVPTFALCAMAFPVASVWLMLPLSLFIGLMILSWIDRRKVSDHDGETVGNADQML